jgi:hypothetical protein
MSLSYWSGVATLALLPLAVIAQQGKQAGPADADAPVPASEYISVFKNYRPAIDAQASPDQTWRTANEAVAGKDAHAGHGLMPASRAQEAVPAPAAPKAAPADPHAGHGGHHH